MIKSSEQIKNLVGKTNSSDVPGDLKKFILERLDQLLGMSSSPSFLPEIDRLGNYIDWVISLPWNKRTEDTLDLVRAREILDKNHYGLDEIKNRVLEYMSVMKLKSEHDKGQEIKETLRAPILCFVGLVGTGKTTISFSIAEALGRKFSRIPLGGMENPLDLRGQSRTQPEAEPGKVIKALRYAKSKNPVILLDEIDRVTETGRASIMGVLVELLDPEQNNSFIDHYIDYPVDLSEVLFIATANNTHNISTAVMDRIEPINMPSYTDYEKVTIGKKYMLPRVLAKAGISEESFKIDDQAWSQIARPLGFDAGIRTLERTIEAIVRKAARMMVEGKGENFNITPENIKEFLPQ